MQPEAESTRRQFARLFVNVPASYVVLPDGSVEESMTRDIGAGGVCLFVEGPLPRGTKLRVEIQLPSPTAPLTFIGEVAWCQEYELVGKTTGGQTHQDRLIQAGVKFVQIEPQDHQALLRYCQLSPS